MYRRRKRNTAIFDALNLKSLRRRMVNFKDFEGLGKGWAAERKAVEASRPIHSDRRVKVLEFDTCVGGCKLPVGLGEVGIAVVLPSGDFLDEGLLVGNPAVEALGRQDAEFRLCQIKPAAMLWSVVPFEALDQPPGFAGRKGFIK